MAPRRTNRYEYDRQHRQWWYVTKHGRERARVLVCKFCGRTFPARQKRYTHYDPKACSLKKCKRAAFVEGHAIRTAKCSGELHYAWTKGERIQGGYNYVWMPNHPSLAGTKRKYVRKCRLVMEQVLGRPLQRYEEVHHINGIKTDDRPENLELWSRSHPAGTRLTYCPNCNCASCMKARQAAKVA